MDSRPPSAAKRRCRPPTAARPKTWPERWLPRAITLIGSVLLPSPFHHQKPKRRRRGAVESDAQGLRLVVVEAGTIMVIRRIKDGLLLGRLLRQRAVAQDGLAP